MLFRTRTVFSALLLCISANVSAQAMGRVSGRVLDQTGAALPGVTYFADEGDFSAAGAANINYVNQLERPIIRVSAGNDGCGRFVGAASRRVGDGYLLVRSS